MSYSGTDELMVSAPPGGLRAEPSALAANAAELASKLFALGVELETLLLKRKRVFHFEVDRFIDEVESKKRKIAFTPQVVTQSVDYDERVSGLYSLFLGLFGYERRVRKMRLVYSKQLNTHEIARQLQGFIAEGREAFEAKVEALLDVDSLVKECVTMAAEKLKTEDTALLKVALRRAFTKISAAPIRIRASEQARSVLTDPTEIESAIEAALKELDRITRSFVSRATSARRDIDTGLVLIMETLKEELVKAFLERKGMEKLIERTISEQAGLPSIFEPSRTLASPLEAVHWQRLLLGKSV